MEYNVLYMKNLSFAAANRPRETLYLEPNDYQLLIHVINMEFWGPFFRCLSCKRSLVARNEERWLVYLQACLWPTCEIEQLLINTCQDHFCILHCRHTTYTTVHALWTLTSWFLRLCSKKHSKEPNALYRCVKSRVPRIWFPCKSWDFLVAQEWEPWTPRTLQCLQELGARAQPATLLLLSVVVIICVVFSSE